MSKYIGYWNFIPVDVASTHEVEAKTFEEAETKLTKWAFVHRSAVDDPMDFEVRKLNPDRFKDENGTKYNENELYVYWQMNSLEIEESSGAETFTDYLANCLSKNGSLTRL